MIPRFAPRACFHCLWLPMKIVVDLPFSRRFKMQEETKRNSCCRCWSSSSSSCENTWWCVAPHAFHFFHFPIISKKIVFSLSFLSRSSVLWILVSTKRDRGDGDGSFDIAYDSSLQLAAWVTKRISLKEELELLSRWFSHHFSGFSRCSLRTTWKKKKISFLFRSRCST